MPIIHFKKYASQDCMFALQLCIQREICVYSIVEDILLFLISTGGMYIPRGVEWYGKIKSRHGG